MRGVRVKLAIGVAVAGVVATGAVAVAGHGGKLGTSLTGFEEVPAVMTTGEGRFEARLSRSGQEMEYRLAYRDLEGGAAPTQAHIHVGQEGANGGISVWLCGSATNPGPAGTQVCPPHPAEITGVIEPADVIGPDGQGVSPGEFDELVRAIRTGFAYANVHTAKHGAGEIRGQIESDNRRR